MKNILFLALLGTLVLVIVFPPAYRKDKLDLAKISKKQYDVVKYVVDTQFYPIYVTKKVKGDTIRLNTMIFVDVPLDADTTAILKDYLAMKVFVDTFRIDSNSYVSVIDTIQKNSIKGRELKASIKYPVITQSTYLVKKDKMNIYVGLTPSFDKVNIINSIGIGAIVKTKNDRVFSLGLGIDNSANTIFTTGIYWKLK
jgi:hypothetical protein